MSHLPGCAADTHPDPGVCFCDKREAFAKKHQLAQDDADFLLSEALRLGIDPDQLAKTW